MAKFGKLMEYTPGMGDLRPLCRTSRPTRHNGTREELAETAAQGWVLVKWLDGGTAYCHASQLRAVGNEPD